MIIKEYKALGGIHPETASIKNILAFQNVKDPSTGKPFTESMLFGIGGGLGASYILWEFEKHGYPSIVLAFNNNANYPVRFIQNLGSRIGVTTQIYETSGIKKAEAQLTQLIDSGIPAIAWMDLGGSPFYFHYLQVGVAVIYGLDAENAWIDNLANKPFVIDRGHLVQARDKVPSFKNRLMTLDAQQPFDLEQAVHSGIQDCIQYLSSKSTSFSLPSTRKWARMMTDQKNKKGWPTVFKDGRGLYGTLRSVYEAVELIGTGRGGLRGVYAEFLDRAAVVLGKEALKETAAAYRTLQGKWSGLANLSLSDEISSFKETKELLEERANLYSMHGSGKMDEISPINDRLYELKKELNDDFPLSENDTMDLFSSIQAELMSIYALEQDALKLLMESMK